LVSSAREDLSLISQNMTMKNCCFHSIGFLCERGLATDEGIEIRSLAYKFPFNWFPLRERTFWIRLPCKRQFCFHSIGFLCERGQYWRFFRYLAKNLRFPFNWFPLRERTKTAMTAMTPTERVSIQLVSSAREDFYLANVWTIWIYVSIQLVSSAREDSDKLILKVACHRWDSFHSIGFLCERGVWGWNRDRRNLLWFPFNWFPLRERSARDQHRQWFDLKKVSIQLVSSAREELHGWLNATKKHKKSFHSIGFLYERGARYTRHWTCKYRKFPFNWFPLRERSH